MHIQWINIFMKTHGLSAYTQSVTLRSDMLEQIQREEAEASCRCRRSECDAVIPSQNGFKPSIIWDISSPGDKERAPVLYR